MRQQSPAHVFQPVRQLANIILLRKLGFAFKQFLDIRFDNFIQSGQQLVPVVWEQGTPETGITIPEENIAEDMLRQFRVREGLEKGFYSTHLGTLPYLKAEEEKKRLQRGIGGKFVRQSGT